MHTPCRSSPGPWCVLYLESDGLKSVFPNLALELQPHTPSWMLRRHIKLSTSRINFFSLSLSYLPSPTSPSSAHHLGTLDFCFCCILDFSRTHSLPGPWVTHVLHASLSFLPKIVKTCQLLFIFQHLVWKSPHLWSLPWMPLVQLAAWVSGITLESPIITLSSWQYNSLPPLSDCELLEGRSCVPLFIFLFPEPSTGPET